MSKGPQRASPETPRPRIGRQETGRPWWEARSGLPASPPVCGTAGRDRPPPAEGPRAGCLHRHTPQWFLCTRRLSTNPTNTGDIVFELVGCQKGRKICGIWKVPDKLNKVPVGHVEGGHKAGVAHGVGHQASHPIAVGISSVEFARRIHRSNRAGALKPSIIGSSGLTLSPLKVPAVGAPRGWVESILRYGRSNGKPSNSKNDCD